MSKKNKVLAKKAVKKSPLKKAVKPPAKKSAPKAAAKPVKKAIKPVAKNKPAAKPQKPVKKAVAKKIVPKKPVKAAKPVAKAPVKNKPVAKKAAPVAAKKKPLPKPAPKKPLAPKKADPKKNSVKVAPKAAKPASAPVKKPLAKAPEKPVKPPVDEKAKAAKEAPKPVPVETTDDRNKKATDVFAKKPAERKPGEVLAITNTIPVKVKDEISASKIASISHSITNPIKKTDSYAVRTEKEPNGKFELEFVVHASAEMLYEFLSTPSGLSEWFCDDLNIRNGIYTFIWNDQLQQARLLKTIDLQLVRFQWVDKTDGSYFEFRIQRDDLTNDISLIITDFADSVGDRESSKLLWNSQVEKLMHVIGSIF